jgi:hypothetical protein
MYLAILFAILAVIAITMRVRDCHRSDLVTQARERARVRAKQRGYTHDMLPHDVRDIVIRSECTANELMDSASRH